MRAYFLLLWRALPFRQGFFPLLVKHRLVYAVLTNFKHFWCSEVTLVTFIPNHKNLEKSFKKIQKISHFFRKNPKKNKTEIP